MRNLALVLIAAAACGDSSKTNTDAAGSNAADAARDSAGSGSGSAAGTAKTHTLFLQTEGVTVTPGNDDATTNTTSVASHSTTLKAWRVGDASRATEIAALTTQISNVLSPYGITVTTTRPASGTYHEVIITDDAATAVGFPSATPATMSLTGCNAQAAPISFVWASAIGSTYDTTMLNLIASYTIAMFGNQGGVPQSNKMGDCMCYAGSACTGTAACTIGGAATPINAGDVCGGSATTMDENADWIVAFGHH